MKRRDFLRKATVAGAGAAMVGCAPSGGEPVAGQGGGIDGPTVQWRLATSFPRSLDILHGAAERVADRVSAMTGGNFTMRVYPAGEIVPALQVMDAVQNGTVQAGYTGGYYYIGKNPALAFDSTIPFGLTARQQYAWLFHGGGLELMNGIYSDFGIVPLPCGSTGAQMGGWFREPVGSLSDLQGIRMRIPGLGGQIMSRLGVTVQVLGGGDIYPALERGAIDATEWVGPYDDEKLGFHEIAPNYYMPGWWEPGLIATLQVSRSAWDELPEGYRHILAEACRAECTETLARYDAANPEALLRLVNDHGVTLRSFSDDILRAAWRESNAYLEEQAADEPSFREVFDSWRAFRELSFPYFDGNEQHYAAFAFSQIPSPLRIE